MPSFCYIIVKIFTEDYSEVELLPRERVLEYLERVAKDLVLPYVVSHP